MILIFIPWGQPSSLLADHVARSPLEETGQVVLKPRSLGQRNSLRTADATDTTAFTHIATAFANDIPTLGDPGRCFYPSYFETDRRQLRRSTDAL